MPLKLRYEVIDSQTLHKLNMLRDRRYSLNFVVEGGVFDRDTQEIVCICDDLEDAWRITQALNMVS